MGGDQKVYGVDGGGFRSSEACKSLVVARLKMKFLFFAFDEEFGFWGILILVRCLFVAH